MNYFFKFILIVCLGVRGTVVAVGSLDRDLEEVFKATNKVDGIQSLNNFQFNSDGSVLARQQYNIGTGRV